MGRCGIGWGICVSSNKDQSNPIVGPTPGSAAGPLAGSAYDFRTLFPEFDEPAPAPAADQEVRPTSTRRGLFQMLRVGKAK